MYKQLLVENKLTIRMTEHYYKGQESCDCHPDEMETPRVVTKIDYELIEEGNGTFNAKLIYSDGRTEDLGSIPEEELYHYFVGCGVDLPKCLYHVEAQVLSETREDCTPPASQVM